MPCIIGNFQHIRPRYEIEQETILDWIAKTHARAAHCLQKEEISAFQNAIRQKLCKIGLGSDKIKQRGVCVEDVFEENMSIYPVDEVPHGHGFSRRSAFFETEVTQIFQQFYPENSILPDHLIHVTCTGYVAPSPAQILVSQRNIGTKTTVTHAYHMGCYASIPAIRMASGYAALNRDETIDIVHTEMGSLHMHPLQHNTEQLLVESLFADGFIKYTLKDKDETDPHFKILTLYEEIIPDSTGSMTWKCDDHAMKMTLSREVPALIARAVGGYLDRLCQRAKVDLQAVLNQAYFAIHPGGPKIIQQVQERLHLDSDQVAHSIHALKSFGNMSSATLPHVWQRMLEDPSVPKKAKIVSLAFGPGLSISGALFEKS